MGRLKGFLFPGTKHSDKLLYKEALEEGRGRD